MARRKKSDMTHAQRVAADNDKFRQQIHAEHVADYDPVQRSDQLERFRRDSYRQALRDAKAAR